MKMTQWFVRATLSLFQPGIAQSDSVPGFGGGVSGGGPEGINHGRGLEAKRNDELPLKQGDGPDSSQVSSAARLFLPTDFRYLNFRKGITLNFFL